MGARYYRRVGRRSGVSFPLWMVLAFWLFVGLFLFGLVEAYPWLVLVAVAVVVLVVVAKARSPHTR